MTDGELQPEDEITFRDLYPGKTDEELRIAEENFNGYLDLVLRMYERIRSDPEAYARFKALTARFKALRMEASRSNPSLTSNPSDP